MNFEDKFKKFYNDLKSATKGKLTGWVFLFVLLIMPAGFLYAENVLIQADKQVFDGEKTIFEGNVKVDYDDIVIKSPKAIVRMDENGKPKAATFVDGAHAVKESEFSRSEVKANIINLSLLKNRLRAEGQAESSVLENKKPIVHINAGSQVFDTDKNIIVATEDVHINYKDIKTISDKSRISINKQGNLDNVELLGKVEVYQDKSIIKADEVFYNPKSNEVVASGNTHSISELDEDTSVIIWADYQQFDNNSSTLITSGNVRIRYKDYLATGPKATFIPENGSTKPNKIIFIGRARIQESQRYVEGDRIEITLEPQNFKAEGNVKTRFTQVDSYKTMNKNNKL